MEAIGREVQRRLDEGSSSRPGGACSPRTAIAPATTSSIVEFESYEAAMDNSARREVGEFAGQLAKLGDAPATLQLGRPGDLDAVTRVS